MYEAGVAEIYDYSMTGPDPLRELIQHFGLQTIPMDAEQVQLDGELLNDVPGMRRKYGAKTADAIEAFRKTCAEMVTPIEYYEGVGSHDNEHPWAYLTCEEVLDKEVADPTAKRFFKVMARSDIATEAHNTNGLNALKNFVMDIDGYIGLYSIQNGNEQLIDCLRSEVDASIQLNHRVLKVGKNESGRYRLKMMNGKGPETRDFDLVLVCLPHSWLATMGWEGEELRKSMVKHVAYFDKPAHYLRVSILFDAPFWGEKIPGAWFMSEAFGGCCVYNEGSRHDVGKHGVLNWLIAGSDALAFANLGEQELIDAALKSLPASLGDARAHFVEGKIHRWLSSVNALPGGLPARDVMTNHRPEPKQHPGLVVVGDYLFDSTLNGLLNSSDAATDIILTEMMRLRRERAQGGKPLSDRIDRDYFANYRGLGPYGDAWRHFTDPDYLQGADPDRLGQEQGLQAPGRGLGVGRTRRRVARTRHRCLGHREQPRHPCQDAEGAEEIQQARLDRRHALQGRRVRHRVRDQPLPCREEAGGARHSRDQPRGRNRRDVRLDHLGHGAGPDRSLRPVARGEEARHLVGMVGAVLRQRFRSGDASQRLHGRDLGRDARRQQGAGAVVHRRRQPALLLLRQGR